MKAIAGIFRTSEEADAAMGDLKLKGFSVLREEPCSEVVLHGFPAGGTRIFPGASMALPGNDLGGSFPANPGTGAEGWAMFEAFRLTESRWRQWAERGCTVVSVGDGQREAVARAILERNGAEEIHPVG